MEPAPGAPHSADGTVRDEVGVWCVRYIGDDYVFMVGVHDKLSTDDRLTMTRVMNRELFDAAPWGRSPDRRAGSEG